MYRPRASRCLAKPCAPPPCWCTRSPGCSITGPFCPARWASCPAYFNLWSCILSSIWVCCTAMSTSMPPELQQVLFTEASCIRHSYPGRLLYSTRHWRLPLLFLCVSVTRHPSGIGAFVRWILTPVRRGKKLHANRDYFQSPGRPESDNRCSVKTVNVRSRANESFDGFFD